MTRSNSHLLVNQFAFLQCTLVSKKEGIFMERVILFDREWNFCELYFQFIIKRDPMAMFTFAPLQSKIAQDLIGKSFKKIPDTSTVVLIEDHKIFTQSTAALLISKKLSGVWPVLYLFIIVPRPIRDVLYRFVAKNRYKWFGKKNHCMVPTPEMKKRFL